MKSASLTPLNQLCLWDSFSYHATAITLNYLKNKQVIILGTDYKGEYLFTIDWAKDGYAEVPHQHKCGHVLRLYDGNFAIMPNNKIKWEAPDFTTNQIIHKKTNVNIYTSERNFTTDNGYEYKIHKT